LTYLRKIFYILGNSYNKKIALLIILILIATILEVLGIAAIIPVVKLVISSEEFFSSDFVQNNTFITEKLKYFSHREIIIYISAFIFLFFTFKTIVLSYLIWRQGKFSGEVMLDISQKLFKIYMYSPYNFHLKKNSFQLIHNISSEVNLLASSIIIPMITLITETVVFVAILFFLLNIETKLILSLGSFIFIIYLAYFMITKNRLYKWGHLRQEHDSLRLKNLQQGFGGIREIKLLGIESYFSKQFNFHTQVIKEAGIKVNFVSLFPRIAMEYIAIIAIFVIVFISMVRGVDNKDLIPLLALFTAATFRMMPSANRILGCLQSLKSNSPVIERIYYEFKNKKNEDSIPLQQSRLNFKNLLEFKNVYFAHEGTKNILENISFKIKKGQSLGILGPSGSGKTTLVDLMLGLIDPTSGTIKIDQNNVKLFKRAWQKKIGHVPQSIYLLDDTLRNNIAIGVANDKINEEKIQKCLDSANLRNYINDLPDGLNTNVGERGVKISGGQLQRVGIARSLYNNPEIIILDEATSSLDMENEIKIINEVNKLKASKTIIFISHRLQAIKNCDLIMKLDKGKIINFGKPSEVLNEK